MKRLSLTLTFALLLSLNAIHTSASTIHFMGMSFSDSLEQLESILTQYDFINTCCFNSDNQGYAYYNGALNGEYAAIAITFDAKTKVVSSAKLTIACVGERQLNEQTEFFLPMLEQEYGSSIKKMERKDPELTAPLHYIYNNNGKEVELMTAHIGYWCPLFYTLNITLNW